MKQRGGETMYDMTSVVQSLGRVEGRQELIFREIIDQKAAMKEQSAQVSKNGVAALAAVHKLEQIGEKVSDHSVRLLALESKKDPGEPWWLNDKLWKLLGGLGIALLLPNSTPGKEQLLTLIFGGH